MNHILDEFPTSKLHKGKNILQLVPLASIFLIGILDFLTGEKVIGSTTVSIFLLPYLPLYLLVKLTSKIRFRSNYVEKITLLGRTQIKLNDIRAYGVCIQYGRFVPKEVNPSEVDENSILADNLIFISTLERFDLTAQNGRNTITFQYRKDIYDGIKSILGRGLSLKYGE